MDSNKITAVIVDDEKQAIDLLQSVLEESHPEVEVTATCLDSVKAVEIILAKRPDVLFLDIQMPGKDGFQVLEEVNGKGFYPKVIFITGYDKFAIRAIRHAALDYLLKPVNPAELSSALSKVKTASQEKLQQSIEQLLQKMDRNKQMKFNTRFGFIIINSNDIVYCEAERNYSHIYLSDGREETLSHPLKYVSEMLNFEPFFKITRSLLINMDYLAKADRIKKEITLQADDKSLHLSVSGRNIKALERKKE